LKANGVGARVLSSARPISTRAQDRAQSAEQFGWHWRSPGELLFDDLIESGLRLNLLIHFTSKIIDPLKGMQEFIVKSG
jgi:hypothetical protein